MPSMAGVCLGGRCVFMAGVCLGGQCVFMGGGCPGRQGVFMGGVCLGGQGVFMGGVCLGGQGVVCVELCVDMLCVWSCVLIYIRCLLFGLVWMETSSFCCLQRTSQSSDLPGGGLWV